MTKPRSDLSSRAEALWRAVTFVSVAQLHLDSNPLLMRPLEARDVSLRPSGHWGTVPGTAWALAHIGLLAGCRDDLDVVPVLGAGHAGVAQLALAWLTGDLAQVRPQFTTDATGLTALVAAFPHVDGLGSEVHPSLPAGAYVGGWLGGSLAYAQGIGLDAPRRVVIPVLGDGECETPTTAAAWLAHRALPTSQVLPIVHVNGQRMGGPSLLGAMSDHELRAYGAGFGWEPVISHVGTGSMAKHMAFHRLLVDCLDRVRDGGRPMVFLRCVKGWSGPIPAHKTPLTDARENAEQREDLLRWLSSYRPAELLDEQGRPRGALADALESIRLGDLPTRDANRHRRAAAPAVAATADGGPDEEPSFSAAIGTVLLRHAAAGDFRVFSPDELASNRLSAAAGEPWVLEALAEEVLLGWLAGWTASGRRGVLISYEAFAPLFLTYLMAQLKQRRLLTSEFPSLNLLLTSYGWQNAYTHGDPSLVTALLANGDPAVRVFTPADPRRSALALDEALRSTGRLNIVVAGKHTTTHHPLNTLDEERARGVAVWPHLSDEGEPDLSLICGGDLPAEIIRQAVPVIRDRHHCRLRVVNVHELTALRGLRLDHLVGARGAVLVVTLGHPAAIWGLLGGRLERPCEVLGWREPPYPMPHGELAAFAGLDVHGITRAAATLLSRRPVRA